MYVRDVQGYSVSEKETPTKIFEPKRKLYNEECLHLYCSPDVIMETILRKGHEKCIQNLK
jgi:hypothetical protein